MITKKIDKFKMYLYDKGGVSGDLIENGYREPEFMWMAKTEIEGNIGMDVGANIGYFSLFLCDKMREVICIEPDERSRKLLKKNINLNNFSHKTKIYDFAMSEKDGYKKIYLAKTNSNLSTLCKTGLSKKDKYKSLKIKTRTIDSLNLEELNFIKMDIEGYEVEVLSGGLETFRRSSNCKILLEVHPQFYSEERNFYSVLKELVKMGFSFRYVVSAAVDCPDLFKKKGYNPTRLFDTGNHIRGLFKDMKTDDAINFCSKKHKQKYFCKNAQKDKISNKIVRSILLVK
ncbi:MAG TPA: FkbM family methyltransferase [Candidatus Paceibacterota bacterium]|nr:FkbM family methyltransferase [Candidatus Paceibacterota bacterium]